MNKVDDYIFLEQGAGEANIGIATLLAMAMEKREGVPFEQVTNWIIALIRKRMLKL